jgi:hypothetical protein
MLAFFVAVVFLFHVDCCKLSYSNFLVIFVFIAIVMFSFFRIIFNLIFTSGCFVYFLF